MQVFKLEKAADQNLIKGRLYIILAAVLWGTSGAAQTYAPVNASPAVLGTFRILIAGIFITVSALARNEIKDFKSFFTPVLFLTGFCQAMFQFCYFSAINLTGVAAGVMVAIGSSPLFAGVLGKVFDKEHLNFRWYLSTFTAVAGLICLTKGENGSVSMDPLGIILALGAGFSYALFSLAAKRIMDVRSEDSVIGISFIIGSLYMTPFFFFHPLSWIISSSGILIILYLGIISAGISYMFYGRGLKTVKISTVGTLTLAEPLTAALLGIFVINEALTMISGFGMILIFVSQIIIVFNSR